jgi:hypothetical protein
MLAEGTRSLLSGGNGGRCHRFCHLINLDIHQTELRWIREEKQTCHQKMSSFHHFHISLWNGPFSKSVECGFSSLAIKKP